MADRLKSEQNPVVRKSLYLTGSSNWIMHTGYGIQNMGHNARYISSWNWMGYEFSHVAGCSTNVTRVNFIWNSMNYNNAGIPTLLYSLALQKQI